MLCVKPLDSFAVGSVRVQTRVLVLTNSRENVCLANYSGKNVHFLTSTVAILIVFNTVFDFVK